MCAISVIHDYYQQRPQIPWKRDSFNELQEILRRLDALDKKLGEPECEDPTKAAWMRAVEEAGV